MGNWGISETATEIEKLKSDFSDFINGMNSCGEIDYGAYSQLFDFTMPLFDKIFELGKTVAQQPLSGSAETASPKSVKPTSDSCERCVK